MNSCSMGEPEKHLHSSDFRSFFHQLKGSPLEPHNTVEKSAKVKRRRSRRERNSARFGRNATDKISEQRSTCRGPQKMLPPFWSSQLSQCAKSTPIPTIKGTCFAKPVIITQNRLTQHLGMFNREVKSADIERLLSPRTEQVVTEVTPIQSETEMEIAMVTGNQSCNANLKSIPNEEFACTGKDLNGTKEDSLPTVVEFLPVSTEEHCGVANVQDVNAGSQPSTASTAVEFSKQTTDTKAFQSSAPEVLNEKENAPCSLTAQAEPGRDKFLVKKLAQELQKLVDLKEAFPGRNVISETRQAVIGVLQGQRKTLPNLSALAQLKKLASGCNGDVIHADFRSPRRREQEELKCKPKSNNYSSRSSDQGIPFKKRRVREQFFNSPLSSSLCTTLRMAEESLGGRESAGSFAEPEGVDQYSFCLTVPPHPHLLAASSLHISDQASGEHCPLNEALLRQGRPEVAKRVFSRDNNSKRHCVPFTVHGSLESADLSMGGNGSGPFFVMDLQQHPYNHELSPDGWNLQATLEAATILNPSQELHPSLPLDMGLRSTERAPSESHTSFDVLKSIWSPKALSRGARRPMSHALSYSRLARQPPSARELNPRPRQPEEFLQVFAVVPQQHYFCGQNPQPEAYVPSRHQQHGNTFSVLAHPRTFCPNVSGKQGRPSNGQQVWGLMEDPERMQRSRETGSSNSGNQIWELERLLQMESAQQLQAFQQLPMSYFPPSEALEDSTDVPLCTSQGHLVGQDSPEPWTFPRMKLY